MAFNFGGTPSFGAAATPASAPAFSFGSAPAASPPAFGAPAAATPGFGFGSTAAAPASSSAFSFASSPAPLFGSTPAAVTTSAPAFGSSPAPSLFGAAPTPSLFGASTSPFGSAAAPSPFGAAPTTTGLGLFQPAGAQQLQQQQQQQPGLITYSTRYDDLPADRQKELQEIQREIGNYREDYEKLERDQRLHDSVAMKKSMEEETSSLKQSLQGMLNSIRADDEALADFREKVLKLLRSTEYAVRTFQRAKLWRDAPQQYRGQIMPSQVQELLSSPVVLPSPYLEQAIQGFQQTLDNYRQVIGELEQALPSDIMASLGATDEASMVQALPLVISHMHDYFVHVAARMERLHQEVQRNKDLFITQRRAEGNYSDPFEESKRYLASSTPGRSADGRGRPSLGNGTPHHGAMVASTPIHGGTPYDASPAGMYTGMNQPTPFGTPFGGPVSPAAGDMSRKGAATTGRRRR